MDKIQFLRKGGLLGMIGSVLWIAGSLLHPFVDTHETIATQSWVWSHVLSAVGVTLLLFGITAIFLKITHKAGKLGIIGYVLAFLGMVDIIVIFSVSAYVFPLLNAQAPALLDANGPFFAPEGLLGIYFASSIATALIGFILFGVSVTKSYKKWPGILIILGALPLVLMFAQVSNSELPYSIGFIMANIGLFELNRRVWSTKVVEL